MNIGRVYFAIFGEMLDAEVVTRELRLTPTRILQKGRPIPKQTWWELSTQEIASELVDVYSMSEEVVEKLVGMEGKIREIAQRYDAETVLEVVLTFSLNEEVSTPAIGFSKKVVRFMSEVGGFIDVDTYRGES